MQRTSILAIAALLLAVASAQQQQPPIPYQQMMPLTQPPAMTTQPMIPQQIPILPQIPNIWPDEQYPGTSNLPPVGSSLNQEVTLQLDGNTVNATLFGSDTLLAAISAAEAQYAALQARQSLVNADLDSYWLLINGILVLLMQAGFALYEAGTVRVTSQQGVFFKSIIVTATTAITWWVFGYGIAYGDNPNSGTRNGFIGNGAFILVSDGVSVNARTYGRWFFEWTYALIPTMIVTAAASERLRVSGLIFVSIIVSGFIYPVIAHWGWSTAGWFSPYAQSIGRMGDQGAFDFAGSGIIFLTGGAAGLAATIAFSERRDRFSQPEQFAPRNKIFVTLGGFLIWFTAFAFFVGRTTALSGPQASSGASVASKVLINGVLGGVGGFLGGFPLYYFTSANAANLNVNIITDSVFAGLAAASAGLGVVEPWAALTIGIFGGIFFFVSFSLLSHRVDDVINGFSSFAVPGVWGLIAVGLFATSANTVRTYGTFGNHQTIRFGLFYGGGGEMLWAQVVAAICIIAWSFVVSLLLFKILSFFPVTILALDQDKGTDTVLYSEFPTAPDSFVDVTRDAWQVKLAPRRETEATTA